MNVTIPDGQSLRIVAAAAAKDDVRYYINGIYLDLSEDDKWLVATDGHVLARVRVDVSDEDAEKLKHFTQAYGEDASLPSAGKGRSLFFTLSGAVPKSWYGNEVILDFANGKANTNLRAKGNGKPLYIELAAPETFRAHFPNWRLVDAHMKTGYEENTLLDGMVSLDLGILARMHPGPASIRFHGSHEIIAVTPCSAGLWPLVDTYISIMPMSAR